MNNIFPVIIKGIIYSDNKYLIVRRAANDDIGANTWEFPGGKMEFGEDIHSALMREIAEEVGLNIFINNLLYATTFYTSPTRQVVLLVYMCEPTDKKVCLSNEHTEYKWVSKEEISSVVDKTIVSDMEKYNIFNAL